MDRRQFGFRVRLRRFGGIMLMLMTGMSEPLLAARFIDAIVAQLDLHMITASDIGLAKALGLYGLAPGTGLMGSADVDRFIDARLVIAESVRLKIDPPSEVLEKAWRDVVVRGGGNQRFQKWLQQKGITEDWARQMVSSDARRKYFTQLRFARFVFIPEEEVTRALGPGRHGPEERDRTRETLRQKKARQDIASWLQEQRKRAKIRRFVDKEIPDPLGSNTSEKEP